MPDFAAMQQAGAAAGAVGGAGSGVSKRTVPVSPKLATAARREGRDSMNKAGQGH